MLTIAAAKAAGAKDRAYKLFDGGGLHLFVSPTGAKSWRLKYRFRGREKLLTIGRFPEVGLAQARSAARAAKDRLAEGCDPSIRLADPEREGESFEQLARAWFEHGRAAWSPAHATDVLASLERDVFPAVGALAPAAIGAPQLLDLLGRIEARGRVESARRLRQRLSAIFGYGIARGLAERDPAAHLGRAMRAGRPPRPQPALTRIEDCRALVAACDRAIARPETKLAMRFLALTAVRLDAVRGMRWGELEDLDGAAPVWRVPAARMKLSRAKKEEARFAHAVPLSPAAVAVLQDASKCINMHNPDALVFPGRGKNLPIAEGALRGLVARTPFAGRHVPHGWRASFSTILNEAMGPEWRGDIDRALAHVPKDKVEAAYNRSQQLDRRRAVFEAWAELLTVQSGSVEAPDGGV